MRRCPMVAVLAQWEPVSAEGKLIIEWTIADRPLGVVGSEKEGPAVEPPTPRQFVCLCAASCLSG
jgi:hypothetical protein